MLQTDELRLLSRNLAKDILERLRVQLETGEETALLFCKGIAAELDMLSDELLTVEEAANFLGLTTGSLKQYCKRIEGREPELPFHKFHGKKYFSKKELTRYLLHQPKGNSK